MSKEDPNFIYISGVGEYAYCPYRYFLKNICMLDFENEHIVKGTILHETVHKEGERSRKEIIQIRGKTDLIEFNTTTKEILPIEYKIARIKRFNIDVQLQAQAFCLEEMYKQKIDFGYFYSITKHQRQRVEFSETLRKTTIDIIKNISLLNLSPSPPEKQIDKNLCNGCSMKHVCLPDYHFHRKDCFL